MNPIEIRLDPTMVETLLDTLNPVLEHLESELATQAEYPEDDQMLGDFWKKDLLDSQRSDLAVIASLFDEQFMDSGRAVIEREDMDKVLRSCSAIRLKLRDTLLAPIDDTDLEEGQLEGVEWTEQLRIGYAAYALFASLQELIVSQMDGPTSEGPEDDLGWDEDLDG